MVGEDSKTLRIASGFTLLVSLVMAAQSAWAFSAARETAGAVLPASVIAGACLAAAMLVGALWTFSLARMIHARSQSGEAETSHVPSPVIQPAAPPRLDHAAVEPGSEALMLLSLLQEKGRFVDFVMDDIAAYSNEQVGAAARVVHQGCREVILDAFAPLPVAPAENARITLEPGYDAGEFRLVGRVPASPPLTVRVTHKGWRARHVKLPRSLKAEKVPENPIIVPAEVAA